MPCQVQACDQAISAIHSSYEKKLEYLRSAFNTYKEEHPSDGGTGIGKGRRRKGRGSDGGLDKVVEGMQHDNAEVREWALRCVWLREEKMWGVRVVARVT